VALHWIPTLPFSNFDQPKTNEPEEIVVEKAAWKRASRSRKKNQQETHLMSHTPQRPFTLDKSNTDSESFIFKKFVQPQIGLL
jgi:hypothetical protein